MTPLTPLSITCEPSVSNSGELIGTCLVIPRVVSGSRDATLRVWSWADGRCLKVLVGHLAAVRCVQYDGKVVVSGAYDYFVKVWNPETGECLHTLAGHTNRVYSLQVRFFFFSVI